MTPLTSDWAEWMGGVKDSPAPANSLVLFGKTTSDGFHNTVRDLEYTRFSLADAYW